MPTHNRSLFILNLLHSLLHAMTSKHCMVNHRWEWNWPCMGQKMIYSNCSIYKSRDQIISKNYDITIFSIAGFVQSCVENEIGTSLLICIKPGVTKCVPLYLVICAPSIDFSLILEGWHKRLRKKGLEISAEKGKAAGVSIFINTPMAVKSRRPFRISNKTYL